MVLLKYPFGAKGLFSGANSLSFREVCSFPPKTSPGFCGKIFLQSNPAEKSPRCIASAEVGRMVAIQGKETSSIPEQLHTSVQRSDPRDPTDPFIPPEYLVALAPYLGVLFDF